MYLQSAIASSILGLILFFTISFFFQKRLKKIRQEILLLLEKYLNKNNITNFSIEKDVARKSPMRKKIDIQIDFVGGPSNLLQSYIEDYKVSFYKENTQRIVYVRCYYSILGIEKFKWSGKF